ncbi:hypothetical protein DRO35_04035 [Candidatus Bathyarchaeota archaeon]|nr:MAG: hypothetical protein DRO35_04035 [Candidatus Bathyarchaeota archaeon]
MTRSIKVSLISEGVLPSTVGGVGRWLNYLINRVKNTSFNLIAIGGPREYRDKRIIQYKSVSLRDTGETRRANLESLKLLLQLFIENDENPLLCHGIKEYVDCPSIDSKIFWKILTDFYKQYFPDKPYLKFFLTARSLLSPLISILRIDNIAECNLYHALNAGYAGFAGFVMKTLTDKPLLVTIHGIYEDEREWELRSMKEEKWLRDLCLTFFRKICLATYEAADLITTVNKSNKSRLIELGAPSNKIKVIQNPVDDESFKPSETKNSKEIVIGTVTRIVPMKGLKNLIQAAKYLVETLPNVRFIVVGPIQDEEYFHECLKLAGNLGVSDRFTFVGQDDPAKWYTKFDVFVLSSLMERSPMAVLEAMASGLPVVCTETPGTREMIGEYWPLAPLRDSKKLAECIYAVVASLRENREKALKIRDEVVKRHSIRRFAEKYLEVYMKLKR